MGLLFLIPFLAQANLPPMIGERLLIQGESYQVEKVLGDGSFGQVYRLRSDNLPKKFLVMKILFNRPQSTQVQFFQQKKALTASQKVALARDGDKKLRFAPQILRVELNPDRPRTSLESSLLYAHPNAEAAIISPLAVHDLAFVMSEESEELSDRVGLAERVLEDLLPEIALLARNNLVHMDIKPWNILMDEDGHFGLTDFDSILSAGEKTSIFTEGYMAPERKTELLKPEPRANTNMDIYSLGATLNDIVTEKDLTQLKKKETQDSDGTLMVRLERVLSFVRIATLPNSYDRHQELMKSEFGAAFKNPDGREVHKFHSSLTEGLPPLYSEFALIELESGTLLRSLLARSEPAIDAHLQRGFEDRRSFLHAYRLAQMLKRPLTAQNKNLADFILKQGFNDATQFHLLKKILQQPETVTPEVAEALLKRYILPVDAPKIWDLEFFEMASRHPEIVKKYEAVFIKSIVEEQSQTSDWTPSLEAWTVLFANDPEPPQEILALRERAERQWPEFMSVFTKVRPFLRQTLIKSILRLNSSTSISAALYYLLAHPQDQDGLADFLASRKIPLNHSHYEKLVNEILDESSPARAVSQMILRQNGPVPYDLIEKIRYQYPDRSFMEILGSRFKQPPLGLQCRQLFN